MTARKSTIGTVDGKPLAIDVDRLVESRLLLQANSGGGKSWALRRILEQTHGKVQQIIIDPEDEFLTLRERFDYVVVAPKDGDCVADPRSAALLARRLLELEVSAILALYEMSPDQRVLFVRNFLDALVNAPKNLWHPVLVPIDEAHMFCPETGTGEADSAQAVMNLMSRGRKRGFCGVLATTRLAQLNKNAAALTTNKLIGLCSFDTDVKRAAGELGFADRESQQRLRDLEPGEFFVRGPALSKAVQLVKVGDVATTHPKAGQRSAAAAPPPRDTIRKVLAELADLPKAAEEEARTMAEAKSRIKTLELELRQVRAAAPPAPKAERVEVPVVKEAQLKRVEAIIARGSKVSEDMAAAARELALAIAAAKGSTTTISGPARVDVRVARPTPAAPSKPAPAPASEDGAADTAITPKRQLILDALAWLESIGVVAADKTQLALFAKAPPTSGGYKNNLGALRSGGFIEYPKPGNVALTESGRARANPIGVPQSDDELHAAIFERLEPAKARVLRVVIDAHPEPVAREDLAKAVGAPATSGGFKNNLGALRTLGVIDYPTPGQVVATPALFIGGAS